MISYIQLNGCCSILRDTWTKELFYLQWSQLRLKTMTSEICSRNALHKTCQLLPYPILANIDCWHRFMHILVCMYIHVVRKSNVHACYSITLRHGMPTLINKLLDGVWCYVYHLVKHSLNCRKSRQHETNGCWFWKYLGCKRGGTIQFWFWNPSVPFWNWVVNHLYLILGSLWTAVWQQTQRHLVIVTLIAPYTEIFLHTFLPFRLFDGKCIEPIKPDVALSGDILEWLPSDDPPSANSDNKKNPHFHQLQCGESTCTVEMAVYCINKIWVMQFV